MNISNKFKKHIKKKEITTEMLEQVLFSLNKRAKNCRDKKQEYYERAREIKDMYRYANVSSYHDGIQAYKQREREYYAKKDFILKTIWNPTELHEIYGNLYYLYVVGNRTFHIPTDSNDLLKGVEPKCLNDFKTEGENIENLISVQFCDKVINLIKSKNYKLKTMKTIKEKVIEAQEVLSKIETKGELFKWAELKGINNRSAFSKFKKALLDINIDYDMKKHGIYINIGKKHKTKRIYNNGSLMRKYLYQPLHINFKNKMVNDENQNFCDSWFLDKEDLSDEMLFSRTINGLKPVSIIYGNKRKFRDIEISKSKFYRKYSGGNRPYLLIAPKGKMKDLFDLDTLKKDYYDNGIDIDIKKVKNKTLLDYFGDWDAQDKDSKIEYWETGLILGYPIENTISLYKEGV